MASRIRYQQIGQQQPAKFWLLAAVAAVVVLAGLGAAAYMATVGHHITGMNNQIVWGMPHVFAVTLILAASGALNVASVGSVFGRVDHKPLARLSGVLAAALLIGGLTVLVLDLGRPDRLIIAMTHYNLRSIFAWNILLYTGFLAIVAVYLWTLMEPRMKGYSTTAGTAAFAWRLILTTGTGSIFGFLLAREAYGGAIMAPLFIAASLAYGTAAFSLLFLAVMGSQGRRAPAALLGGISGMMGVFLMAVLLLLAAHFFTLLYMPGREDVVRFLLVEGGSLPMVFWLGKIILGAVIPAVLLLNSATRRRAGALAAASVLVLIGGFSHIFVMIVGAQSYPMQLFPGREVSGAVFDGRAASYAPTAPELLLGFGGIALVVLVALVALRFLALTPKQLEDEPEVGTTSADESEATGEGDGGLATAPGQG